MKHYFAYVRVSDPRQGKGVSLGEQEEAIRAYAAQKGFDISEWFRELETASAKGRRVFTRMLAKLQRGEADGVIIHKIDRSARNLEDWTTIGRLVDRGVDVQFAHDRIDLHTRGGRLSADIMAVVAADYIRNLREEVKKGFYGRLKQGVYPLPAPMGYIDKGAGHPKEIDGATGPMIKEAFEIYARGDISIRELRALLEAKGLRSRRGGRISIAGIAKMLRNPFYVGLIRIARTNEMFEGAHEPLISRRTFDGVQAIIDGRKSAGRRRHDFKYRRYLRCACGRLLTGELQRNQHVYYRCHAETCPGVSIGERDVDAEVARLLPQIVLTGADQKVLRDMVDKHERNEHTARQKEQARIAFELNKLNASMDRLVDALVDGTLEKELFEHKKRLIMEERSRLAELAKRHENLVSLDEAVKKFEQQNTALLGYKVLPSTEQRILLDSVSSNAVLVGKKLEFKLNSPYQLLRKLTDPAYCGPYRDRFRTFEELAFEVWRLAQAGWPANDNEPAEQELA
ncbi:MAG TPA: recombinase family protein [Terriglobales bacterium]|nr:recombinase family protein [Terriglobales bacterium]